MTFDLRQHIRDVLAETAEENLDILTAMVFDRTPHNAIREAYRQALTEAVRAELPRAIRPDQRVADTHSSSIGAGSDSTTGGSQSLPDTHRSHAPSGGGNVRNSRAARLRRARFRLNVHVGQRTFRNILDCTAEDLLFAAAECDRMAEANAQAAERYRRLVKVMLQRQVEKVADLTDEEIEEVIGNG
jgi:hypothetical protein